MQNFYDFYEVEKIKNLNQDVMSTKKTPKLALCTRKYFALKQIHNASILWDMSVCAVSSDEEKLKSLLETKNATLWNTYNVLQRRAKKLSSSATTLGNDKILMAQNNSRLGHYFSVCIATNLPQEDSKVVTGFVYGKTDESKLLHSWVETIIDGQEVVIDVTKDAIIDKETYYGLLVSDVINETSKQQLTSDANVIYPFIKDKRLSFEAYLVDREEVIKRIFALTQETENENA